MMESPGIRGFDANANHVVTAHLFFRAFMAQIRYDDLQQQI
jgi:hypothetical protein